MTPEEAYEVCRAALIYATSEPADMPDVCDMDAFLADFRKRYDLETLADAVERQIPMKPTGVCGSASCRRCGCRISFLRYELFKDSYCSHCGQKIDWSDYNEETD